MTLSTIINRISYAGNGSTTLFAFPYKFQADEDLVVILKNDTTGVEVEKTLTTHYTVTGEGEASGGSVTMLTAPASGETLIIYRDPAKTQETDLTENDPLPAETVEDVFDKLTMIAQRLQDQLDNSLKLPSGESADMTLPTEVDRAGMFLAFDVDGLPIASAGATDGVVVSAFMETVLDDTTAAAARATLGIDGSSGNIATGDIANLAVTTPKIAANAVTVAKLDTTTTRESKNLFNHSLAATVASSALTIALKDASGADASSTSPVTIAFRSATAATGTPVIRSVTAALSTVISSGSTAGHKAATLSPIHVYALDNAGTVELAWSTTRMWDEQSLQTTTAEGGAGAADSATVLYSTTARSNVAIRYLGTLFSTQTVAGTWAATMTKISLAQTNQVLAGYSEIFVSGANGHGSTDTKIRRFVTTQKSVGSAITLATSAANGSTFTITEAGIYAITYQDFDDSGIAAMGISVNSTELTTSIGAISINNYLGRLVHVSSQPGCFHVVAFLNAGDVVRAHTDASPDSTADTNVNFRIVKIAG